MAALKADRDKKTNQIIATGESKNLFMDVDAINRTLNENIKTADLFEIISNKYKKLAGEVISYALDDLLTSKKYELITINVPDITDQYHRIETKYKNDIAAFPSRDETLKAYVSESFATEVIQLINYCTATNNNGAAIQIQAEALALVNDANIRKAL